VSLTLLSFANGTWRIQWQDTGPFTAGDVIQNNVATWKVSYTPVSLAGPASSILTWPAQVLAAGTIVDSRPSAASGQILSYTQTDKTFVDAYIQVYGVSSSGKVGNPSYPLRLVLSSNDATVPGETLSQGLGFTVHSIGGQFYNEFDLQYLPPSVTTSFSGV